MEDNQIYEDILETGSLKGEPVSKMKRKAFTTGIIVGLLVAFLALLAGNFIARGVRVLMLNKNTSSSATLNEAEDDEVVTVDTNRKMMAIEDVIKHYYLEDVSKEELENGIYSGMVNSLEDPYSAYYSVEDLKEMQQDVEGVYSGIGAYVALDVTTTLPMISGVIEGTPAEEADLRAGDIIYMVDGTTTQGMDTDEVVKLIRGEEGTTVHLTLVRESASDYIEVDVERRKVETPTVNYEMMENNIAYIQITEFDKVTSDQFAEALAVCKGSGMEAMVLDLRSNPGGSLDVVCDISRKILPKGLIVYTEDKYGEREEFTCDGQNELTIPMVVLVNGYSASASEILSGAIKDYGIGTIMGTTTFGKGIVQRVIGLSDGSALKLTISTYYTPKGNNIHGVGVEPDVVVEFDSDAYYNEDVDNQLNAAIDYLNENYYLETEE